MGGIVPFLFLFLFLARDLFRRGAVAVVGQPQAGGLVAAVGGEVA